MTDKATNDDDDARAFLQAEYTSLRNELLKRVELGQRLLEITLVSAAAILTINVTGAEFARVLLAYPILVMFLAFAGLQHGLQVRVLATYIKTEIEPRFRWRQGGEDASVGFEAWRVHNAPRQAQRLATLASLSMFVGIQVLVFSVGLVETVTRTQAQPADIVLIIVGAGVIFVTAAVLIAQLGYRR
jgi:hypothetical protein